MWVDYGGRDSAVSGHQNTQEVSLILSSLATIVDSLLLLGKGN